MRHHRRGLRRELVKSGLESSQVRQLIDALQHDYQSAPITERQLEILKYAIKLTRTPQAMQPSDVEALRRVGLDDLAIHDVCAVTAYFAFVNRIADGLGVELE